MRKSPMVPRLRASHKGRTWKTILSSVEVKCQSQKDARITREAVSVETAACPIGRHCHLLAT